MTIADDVSAAAVRYAALDAAIETAGGAARPRHARQCAALVALAAQDGPEDVAARVRDCALGLRGAPGVSGDLRPIFAAALAAFGRSADDYLTARLALLPALESRGRKSLPAAAAIYAAAGRTALDDGDRDRIRAIVEPIAAPWWSSRARWNGVYAAAFALRGDDGSAVTARLDAARRALLDAGAPANVVDGEARRLALSAADATAAALTWRRLHDARRERPAWRKLTPGVLMGCAARAGHRSDDAVAALDQAVVAVGELRPRPHGLIRPFLAAGLAVHALGPSREPVAALDAVHALEAALLVIEANDTIATLAISSAAIASSG